MSLFRENQRVLGERAPRRHEREAATVAYALGRSLAETGYGPVPPYVEGAVEALLPFNWPRVQACSLGAVPFVIRQITVNSVPQRVLTRGRGG